MTLDPARPDLAVSLRLDAYAPRAARHHVAQIDRPAPDLRDAVLLLSSELVTHAVERAAGATIELRAWMPRDVVRVEVHGSPEMLERTRGARHDPHEYGTLLLDQIADRWSVESNGSSARVWFEIDRRSAAGAETHAH